MSITNVALGAAGFTEISQNNAETTRAHYWLGYLGETGLAANDGSNITMTIGGTASIESYVLTKEFQYVSQTQPILASSSAESFNPSAGSPLATAAAISYGDKDMIIGLSANRSVAPVWSVPASFVEEQSGINFYSAMAAPMTGSGTTSPTSTMDRFGFILGATVQSECNNP